MRITNSMLLRDQTGNIQKNLGQISDRNRQINTGKLYEKVSDNPVQVSRIMTLEADIANHSRYGENIETAMGWLDASDSSLQELMTTTKRMTTLITKASADGDPNGAIRQEMSQLIEQFATLGNSTYDNRYIFSGTMTDTPPFQVIYDTDGKTAIGVQYNGNDESVTTEIEKNVNTTFSVNGNDILGNPSFSDTFGQIMTALKNEDKDALKTLNTQFTKNNNSLYESVGKIGARANRMEAAKTNHDVINEKMTNLLSSIGDTDVETAIVELESYMLAYQISLQTTSKIANLTLMNYIR